MRDFDGMNATLIENLSSLPKYISKQAEGTEPRIYVRTIRIFGRLWMERKKRPTNLKVSV